MKLKPFFNRNFSAQKSSGYLSLPGESGNYVSSAHKSAGTGDITIIAKIAASSYSPTVGNGIFLDGNSGAASSINAYFYINVTTGVLVLARPTGSTARNYISTVNLTTYANNSIIWVKAEFLQNDNGSSSVRFYISSTGINWTQFGNPVTNANTGGANSNATGYRVGSNSASAVFSGKIYSVRYYSGIEGSGSEVLIADFNPHRDGGTPPTTTSFVSSTTGETWTLNGPSTSIIRP